MKTKRQREVKKSEKIEGSFNKIRTATGLSDVAEIE
jgi:hypothetical protein